MTAALSKYIRSPDEIITNAAHLTINAMAAFNAKQMTEAEYVDVMHDILDLQKIEKLTNDMQRQNEIEHAFEEMKSIANTLMTLASL